MRRILLCLGALAVCAAVPQCVHAQTATNLEMERALRHPGTIPYDGEPYTQRYSYGTYGMFYLNGNPRYLNYLDYLDRADRAAKFGYRMPIDPFFPETYQEDVPQPVEAAPPVVVSPAPARIFGGFGFGQWRRR